MKFDRISSQDRAVLVQIVQHMFQGDGAAVAAELMHRISSVTLRSLQKIHAEEIVNQAVRLWIDASPSRGNRKARAMLAGIFLPVYRREAARQVEEALSSRRPRGKVVDAEYEVKR